MKSLAIILGLVLILSFGCTQQSGTKYVCSDELKTVVDDPSECPPDDTQGQQETRPLLDTWDLQMMQDLGMPIHCTLTFVDIASEQRTYEMYIKGEDFVLEILPSQSHGGAIVIAEGDWVYLSTYDGSGINEDCVWNAFDNARVTECYPQYVSTDEMYLEQVPEDVESTCNYESFSDEKFDTPGRVCDLTDDMCAIWK